MHGVGTIRFIFICWLMVINVVTYYLDHQIIVMLPNELRFSNVQVRQKVIFSRVEPDSPLITSNVFKLTRPRLQTQDHTEFTHKQNVTFEGL